MLDYAVFVDGLDDLANLEGVKKDIEQAAYRAINATADWSRSRSADEILMQIAFPESYLRPSEGRLKVARRAGPGSLSAEIWARRSATSLARFVTNGSAGKKGLDVKVKKGKTQHLPNAFLMKLKSGANFDTKSNLGLAIRTKKGERPDRAWKPVRVSDTLWLLYGPAIQQVFQSVREDVRPGAEDHLRREFQRLLDLK